jgi:hypothetical protein
MLTILIRENNDLCHVTSYIMTCRRIAVKKEALLPLNFLKTGRMLTSEALQQNKMDT